MYLSIKKILVATDLSMPALDAVRYSAALARDHGAEILLVHVIAPMIPLTAYGPEPVMFMQPTAEIRSGMKEHLERIKSESLSGVPQVRIMVLDGSPHIEIVRVAREESVDLIVLGSTGHSALAAAILGSTADRVARKAECPVLLFRPKGRKMHES